MSASVLASWLIVGWLPGLISSGTWLRLFDFLNEGQAFDILNLIHMKTRPTHGGT